MILGSLLWPGYIECKCLVRWQIIKNSHLNSSPLKKCYCTQLFWVFENHVISPCQGLFPLAFSSTGKSFGNKVGLDGGALLYQLSSHLGAGHFCGLMISRRFWICIYICCWYIKFIYFQPYPNLRNNPDARANPNITNRYFWFKLYKFLNLSIKLWTPT